ncbi:hypothetical protein EsDP_00005446 [Epichloe bromicola]|uniref:Alpha and gamma adaptin binding protein p34 n=1 Tax=Epichloe bromicola TaxID=79588 RepID=A0ABQ0CUP0_9HYPO
MQVGNPRRILAVSLEGQADYLRRVVKDLTGSTPQPASASLAGTTHTLPLKTQYYTASVPVWLDLMASPSEWAASFLSDEAAEVLAVLGGLILIFALPGPPAQSTATAAMAAEPVREAIAQMGRVVNKGLGGWEWDGVRLAIGVGDTASDADTEEWDELCAEAGLEFVQLGASQPALNTFGEKTGIARVKEALESNDWAQDDAEEDVSEFGDFQDDKEHLDAETLDFGYDGADFKGLKRAIWEAGAEDGAVAGETSASATASSRDVLQGDGGDVEAGEDEEDKEVVAMENMMRKLQAVREAGEGLPEAQRRRMAARAVQEVMKEL